MHTHAHKHTHVHICTYTEDRGQATGKENTSNTVFDKRLVQKYILKPPQVNNTKHSGPTLSAYKCSLNEYIMKEDNK